MSGQAVAVSGWELGIRRVLEALDPVSLASNVQSRFVRKCPPRVSLFRFPEFENQSEIEQKMLTFQTHSVILESLYLRTEPITGFWCCA